MKTLVELMEIMRQEIEKIMRGNYACQLVHRTKNMHAETIVVRTSVDNAH